MFKPYTIYPKAFTFHIIDIVQRVMYSKVSYSLLHTNSRSKISYAKHAHIYNLKKCVYA